MPDRGSAERFAASSSRTDQFGQQPVNRRAAGSPPTMMATAAVAGRSGEQSPPQAGPVWPMISSASPAGIDPNPAISAGAAWSGSSRFSRDRDLHLDIDIAGRSLAGESLHQRVGGDLAALWVPGRFQRIHSGLERGPARHALFDWRTALNPAMVSGAAAETPAGPPCGPGLFRLPSGSAACASRRPAAASRGASCSTRSATSSVSTPRRVSGSRCAVSPPTARGDVRRSHRRPAGRQPGSSCHRSCEIVNRRAPCHGPVLVAIPT